MFGFLKDIANSVKETTKQIEAESQIKQANRALEYMYSQLSKVAYEKLNSPTWKEVIRERTAKEMNKVYSAMTYLDSLHYYDLESFLYTQKAVDEILNEVDDDIWIEKLWQWADENKIPNLDFHDVFYEGYFNGQVYKGFPRDKNILMNLEELDLSSYQLSYLPYEIGRLTKLTKIYLSYNKITSLPLSFAKLVNLKELNLYSNCLEIFPNPILKIRSLESLTIDCRCLDSIPSEIYRLDRLKILRLYSCPIDEVDFAPYPTRCHLPNELSRLINLKSLSIKNMILDEFPSMVCKLTNLQELDIDDSKRLEELPKELFNLTNLRTLKINFWKLKTCPNEIGNLINLKTLKLGNLTKLPESICNLHELESLSLMSSVIHPIRNFTPKQIEWLKKLHKNKCYFGFSFEKSINEIIS